MLFIYIPNKPSMDIGRLSLLFCYGFNTLQLAANGQSGTGQNHSGRLKIRLQDAESSLAYLIPRGLPQGILLIT